MFYYHCRIVVDAYETMVYAQNKSLLDLMTSNEEEKIIMQSRYKVTGLGCEACVKRVEKAVSALDGVERAMVDLNTETLTVEYDESKVSFDTLKNAVDEAGYGLEEV